MELALALEKLTNEKLLNLHKVRFSLPVLGHSWSKWLISFFLLWLLVHLYDLRWIFFKFSFHFNFMHRWQNNAMMSNWWALLSLNSWQNRSSQFLESEIYWTFAKILSWSEFLISVVCNYFVLLGGRNKEDLWVCFAAEEGGSWSW